MRKKILEKLKLERAAKNLESIIRYRYGKQLSAKRIISYAKQSETNRETVYSTLEAYNFEWDPEWKSWLSNLPIDSWITVLAEERIEDNKLEWAARKLENIMQIRFAKKIEFPKIIAYAKQSQAQREAVYASLEGYGFSWDESRTSWTNNIIIQPWISAIVAQLFIEHEEDR
jgi:hypothetical protein